MAVNAAASQANMKTGTLASLFWRGLDLFVTFILQVLGGAGAVWGCSEWASVRAGPNNNDWRVISSLVGLACLARWCSIQFTADRRLDGVLASFLLQVLGAAGAIWGIAEICGLRVNYPEHCQDFQSYDGFGGPARPDAGVFQGSGESWSPGYDSCSNTYTFWRSVCTVVFLVFLLRWNQLVPKGGLSRALDTHAATFVLDVVGGAGAVWGASEILTLRLGWGDVYFGQPSFDIWRCVCAPFFLICLFSWAADWRSREARYAQQGEQEEQEFSQKAPADGEALDTIAEP
eukprot:TRINITY_DN5303_c0_g1_i2.p2 TRINITY_DN5303_c0_g1~~TRINITY_DN5303_c0_g1_i2.p2  ORF type:complete len:310 (-),score=39.73 TRINITY_DN5303_c0_g1_i2:403-1269(-)